MVCLFNLYDFSLVYMIYVLCCSFMQSWFKISSLALEIIHCCSDHLRDVFGKAMGLSDQDIVALSGGHTIVC
ncbi:hypothetical protein TanjilG_15761 [Lupinus angustifolius]|uniref:L-ascorbate peroxidase n=1 Tax=Lupinus angustifolius TaxID=3871 RepID=A0A1J7GEK6_LUPAN|nr:hypothetical protein TanjilG_15761 [Lupinus angustifolius]